MRRTAAAVLVAAVLMPASVMGQDDGIVSAVRLGVLAHDQGPFTSNNEDTLDVNMEVLFVSPDFLEPIFSPEPHVGVTFNADDDATDQIYAGLTWSFDLTDSIFVDLSFGGALHNGETTSESGEGKQLGCSLLFREAAGLGYRFADNHEIALHLDHISNANLCEHNAGLETLGVRYGYRF
jgi:lipid A 3-O-deacylase